MKNIIILIAGNDDKLKKTINLILRKEGFKVINLNEITEITEYISFEEPTGEDYYILLYTLFITDYKFIELVTRLQRKLQNLKVIIIYEYLDKITVQRIKKVMKCIFIEKSFDAHSLIETIISA